MKKMIALDEPHGNGSRELCRIREDRVSGLHVSSSLENENKVLLVFTAESPSIVIVDLQKIGTDDPPISAALPIHFL